MNIRRSLLVGLSLCSLATSAEAERSSLLYQVGLPKVAPYVRLSEFEDLESHRFVAATDLHVHRLDGGKIRLNPKLDYLWAIAEDGAIFIAPDQQLPDGQAVGHVNLLLGRLARLAGELQLISEKKHLWALNNNSRFGHKQQSTKAELEAARRWFQRIGIKGKGTRLTIRFEPPLPMQSTEARNIGIFLRSGGYVLVPNKGESIRQLPRGKRTLAQRLRWAKQTQRKHPR